MSMGAMAGKDIVPSVKSRASTDRNPFLANAQMHLIDLDAGFMGSTPIVGSTIPIAVGAAFGSVMQNDDR